MGSNARSVCGAFDTAFAKLLWSLVIFRLHWCWLFLSMFAVSVCHAAVRVVYAACHVRGVIRCSLRQMLLVSRLMFSAPYRCIRVLMCVSINLIWFDLQSVKSSRNSSKTTSKNIKSIEVARHYQLFGIQSTRPQVKPNSDPNPKS